MPMDRGLIEQQLQALGEGPGWWERRELRDLPAVLHGDERILALAIGKVGRVRWLRRVWLIVVTDQRLVCMRSAAGSGWRQLEVDAARMGRVAIGVGLFRGRVTVNAGDSTYRLLAPRAEAYKLFNALSGLASSGRVARSGFGPTRMVRRVFDHMLALPTAAFEPDVPPGKALPAPGDSALEQRVERLEEQVQELQEQVGFLEQLLRQRQRASFDTAEGARG